MRKLLTHATVAGVALAMLVAPAAGATVTSQDLVTSADAVAVGAPSSALSVASAVKAAKKAKKKKVKTTSSFGMTKYGGEAALGTVSSKNAKCVKNRKVKLFQIRPGKSPKLVGVDRKTGKPSGNGAGYWVIPVNLKVGKKYQAVVTKRVVGKITCKAYKSSKLPWTG